MPRSALPGASHQSTGGECEIMCIKKRSKAPTLHACTNGSATPQQEPCLCHIVAVLRIDNNRSGLGSRRKRNNANRQVVGTAGHNVPNNVPARNASPVVVPSTILEARSIEAPGAQNHLPSPGANK